MFGSFFHLIIFCLASSVAVGMAMSFNRSLGRSSIMVHTELSQQIFQWIAMKCGLNIHGPQMMNPNHFGDPLTFPLAPS